MEVVSQKLDEIVASLRPLTVEWQDDTADRVIASLKTLRRKKLYSTEDVRHLLDKHFEDAILICRLFLGLSKDQFESTFKGVRGEKGTGIKAYHRDPSAFVDDLLATGLLEAMAEVTTRKLHWSDVLVERLRSGRGSAITGQRRGRDVEDFAESIVARVFGQNYQSRCTFSGPRGAAKCDFAIPTKSDPRIVIEAKGYGATGSKMTDILGDIEKIIAARRSDTAFLFFTDGLTWKQRKSDLRKIVVFQNNGDISRIYTHAMADEFEADLNLLRNEYNL